MSQPSTVMSTSNVQNPFTGTLEELQSLSRKDLQEIAQKHGIPASFKSQTIIEKLMRQVPKQEKEVPTFQIEFNPISPLYLCKFPDIVTQPETMDLSGKQDFFKYECPLSVFIPDCNIPLTTEKLIFSGCLLGDEQLNSAIYSFQPALTYLDLDGNLITDYGLSIIIGGLAENNTLKVLNLAENLLRQPLLADFIEFNTAITSLNLSGNKISDDAVFHIAPALKLNKTICNLNLSNNEITDKCLEALCDVLTNNRCLTELSLRGNFIQSDSQLMQYITTRLEENLENKFFWHREGRGLI